LNQISKSIMQVSYLEAVGLFVTGLGLGLVMLIKLAVYKDHPLWRLSVCGLTLFLSTKLPKDLQQIIGMGVPYLYEVISGLFASICFLLPKYEYDVGDIMKTESRVETGKKKD